MKKIHFLWIAILVSNVYSRVDGHAPISVMGDHLHKKGSSMISVRYMQMLMKDLYEGGEELSEDDFFNDTSYMMMPKDMTMTMTMLGYMYGVSDKINFSLMVNYLSNSMDMVRRMGRSTRSMQSNNLGDTSLNLLYGHKNSNEQRLISKFKLLLPTGNFQEKKSGSLLGFPMQTGVGSYALGYGLTYTKFFERSSIGTDINYLAILNRNSQDYQVGNSTVFNTWYAYNINDSISANLLFNIQARDPYSSDITNPMSPTLDDSSQHGVRGNAKIGLNYLMKNKNRLAFDYGIPLYRDLAGYQLDQASSFTIGFQKAY